MHALTAQKDKKHITPRCLFSYSVYVVFMHTGLVAIFDLGLGKYSTPTFTIKVTRTMPMDDSASSCYANANPAPLAWTASSVPCGSSKERPRDDI